MPVAPSGSRGGGNGASQVPGGTPVTMPCSRTPVESHAPSYLRCSDAAFRTIHAVGFHDNKLSRLCHTAWITRCLRFAARVTPAPRKTRFRLLARLYRTAQIGLLGSLRKVSTVYVMRLPPFPGFAWRKDGVFRTHNADLCSPGSGAVCTHRLLPQHKHSTAPARRRGSSDRADDGD